jgi:uncharacterized membrane protein
MIVLLAIAYALISCLFMMMGYLTTARGRLHLGLFIIASLLWPVSLIVVIGYVCGQRAGLFDRHSDSPDASKGTPESIVACAPDYIGRRMRQTATHRAGN